MITSFVDIVYELRTMIKRLNERGMWKLLLVAGCWLLVAGKVSFGQTNYYSKSTGNLNIVTNWGQNTDGSGLAPVNFTSANQVFNIRNNATPTIAANWTVSGTNSKIIVGDGTNSCKFTIPGALVLTSTSQISNNGTLKITSTAVTPYSGTLTVNSGGTYEHAINGGTIPAATWNASSNCNITGVTVTEPNGLSQSFGNFKWNCTGQTGSELNINPLSVSFSGAVTGDFTVASTGTGSIRLSNITPRVLDISGNFNISGGIFILAINTGSSIVNIGGDFNMTGGTLIETGSSSGLFVFNNGGTTQNFRRTVGTISNNIGFTVNSNVTIDFGTSDYANGGGAFTLSNGATLQTANTTGINGSIQTTSRSLSTSANYTFDGTAAQVTGTFLPSNVNNFTINNVNGVTLTNSVTDAGTLYMISGNINTGANTFILSNPVSSALNYNAGIIVGKFERFINTTSVNYLFPVGTTAQIQSLTANFINLTAGSLLVQFISGDPGNSALPLTDGDGSQVTNQFTSGYWSTLAKNSLASTNYNVDLNATGFGPYTINAGTRLIKRTDTGGSWLLNGTHSNAVGSVVKRTGMSGIYNAGGGTQFGIGKSGPGITTQPSNKTVCENAIANFSITATGYALTYQWYKAPGILLTNDSHYGGVTTLALSITTVVIGDAGNFYCIVTDGNGSTVQSASATLTVNPLPVSTASNNGPVCVGSTLSLTGGPAGMTTYSWTGPNGFTSLLQNPTVGANATLAMAGVYTLTATNASGCQSAPSAATVVTVNGLPATPVITADGPTTFCAGGSVTLISDPATSFLWSNAATTPGINVTVSGSYSVQVTDANGCQSLSSAPTAVTVHSLPIAPSITASGPTTFCIGGSVTLTSSPEASYLWSIGATTSNISITSSGSYTVQVTDANGCLSAQSTPVIVTVNALPTVSITSSAESMCTGDLRILTGSPSGGTFILSNGPGSINGNVLSVTSSGNINLEYVYTGICTNKALQSIIVDENVIANAGQDQQLLYVFDTQMAAEMPQFGTGEWSLISGSGIIRDIHSPTTSITNLSTGENKFSWKVQNGNCEATDEVSIVVNDIVTPTVITPNEDGLNDELIFPGLDAFPGTSIIIYNRWGNEVYRSSDYKNDWNGEDEKKRDLQEDTYYYILKISNGRILKGFVEIKRH